MDKSDLHKYPQTINVLLIGSGVIGSIYAGQLSLAGHRLWVLAYGAREEQLSRQGIRLHNLDIHTSEIAKVRVAQTANDRQYDLVIVAVQAGQLASTFPTLRALSGTPHIVFFGNNPDGHAAIPTDIPGSVELAFPGVSGKIKDGIVIYVTVTQQPTMLEASSLPVSIALQTALESRGFPVRRTAHMDGWLAYHAVFISCILSALQKSAADPGQLGRNPRLLGLMCRAIEEGFASLKSQHVQGLPLNLAILHSPLLRPFAVRYWGGVMRSPKGELYFAAHLRHAPDEMQTLAGWVLEHVTQDRPHTGHIKILLGK